MKYAIIIALFLAGCGDAKNKQAPTQSFLFKERRGDTLFITYMERGEARVDTGIMDKRITWFSGGEVDTNIATYNIIQRADRVPFDTLNTLTFGPVHYKLDTSWNVIFNRRADSITNTSTDRQ